MAILFYDHLVYKEDLHSLIEQSESPDNIKAKTKLAIDDVIHHHVIAFVLESLPEEKHRTFLVMLEDKPYDPEILIFLEEHIGPDFEPMLSQEINKLLTDIKQDLSL